MNELRLRFGDLVVANVEVQINATRQKLKVRARVVGFSDDDMLISLLDDVPLLCGQQIPIPLQAVPFAVEKVDPPPVRRDGGA